MTKETKRDIGVGLFFLIFSVAYFCASLNINSYNPFHEGGLDSKSMPQALSGLMFVLSLLKLIPAIIKSTKQKGNTENASEKTKDDVRYMTIKFAICVLFLAIYIFCFARIGFIISSILFLFAMIFFLTDASERKKNLVFTIVFSILVPFVVYVIFTKTPLMIMLPRGIFGF